MASLAAVAALQYLDSIDLKVVLKRKSDKDFKKVGPICGNLSFKSQLIKN